ncbi:MAG: potassium channel protein [Planctomycetes bacterium]|nr:potassium channel protein [Planctomycetota bacterium]MBL7042610.1 potassium channel protein [Pirellulaceae bacterium]
MRAPLHRIRLGALVLAVIFVAAVLGYHALGYDWLDAVWMVVITISSVGYGEETDSDASIKMLSIAVIVFGLSAAAYTIGGLLQMITEGELERALGRRRMTRDIERLKGHVVICGFGRMGEMLARDLKSMRRLFVIVDNDSERIADAETHRYLCLSGDATEEQTLREAGIEQASALVTGLPNDAASVFITLTSRNLNPNLQIIARAEHPSTEKKLRQAGADRVVMPALVGARHMARLITRPSTADLMELVSETSFLDYELDEIAVPDDSKMAQVTVRETEAHRRHRLLVVAVKEKDGNMVLNPDAEYRFKSGDVVIFMGHTEDIARFRKEYGL